MYDLIVIGAGAMGSATAYHAAKRGLRVLLLEQYAIDHQRGSSYGYSRIIRYAYDHPVYVELMKAAYPAWREFEEDCGETLYVKTGGIDFAPPGEPLFASMVDSLTQQRIPFQLINASGARELFPQFHLDDDMIVLYQADAGVLRASKAVQAHVRMARQYGAEVCDDTSVTAIKPVGDGVEVLAGGTTYTASKLVVASGGWMQPMMQSLGLDLPLKPIAAQENYFAPLDPAQFTTDHFPVWIGHLQERYGQILYGLPSIDGSGAKIGLHTGPALDPTSPERTPDLKLADEMQVWAQKYIPQMAGERIASRVCIYTLTPDEHFIIDAHPEYPQITIASCCSGHGFKFSTLMGSILTDFALTGQTAHDISLFRLSRFSA
jgi:monomeric sarcosine oxidase